MFGKSENEPKSLRFALPCGKKKKLWTLANHPMFGRTGALNPMYGIVPANAMTINVYSLDNVLA